MVEAVHQLHSWWGPLECSSDSRVPSASNRNEQQGSSLGRKVRPAGRVENCAVPVVRNVKVSLEAQHSIPL